MVVLVNQRVLLLLLQVVELLLVMMLLLLRGRRSLLLVLRRSQFPRPAEIPHGGVVLPPLLGLLLLRLLLLLQRVHHQRHLLPHHRPGPTVHVVVRDPLGVALERKPPKIYERARTEVQPKKTLIPSITLEKLQNIERERRVKSFKTPFIINSNKQSAGEKKVIPYKF